MFEHFGIIRFWVMLWTNRETHTDPDTQTDADERLTPTTLVGVSKNRHYHCQHTTRLKVGFHYPSSRAEFTGRVDGPRTRVHFLTPVNSGRELG